MTIEPTAQPLYVARSSHDVWENWREIANARLGTSTLTLYAVEAAWRTAAINENGKTVAKAQQNKDGFVIINVLKTNVVMTTQVTPRHHFLLLSIEPHPFHVESHW